MAALSTQTAEREGKVFANVLGSVVTTFDDPALATIWANAVQQSTTPESLAAFYRTTESLDVSGLLRRLGVPTLVILEPAFPFGSFELCREVAAGIKDAKFVVVEDKEMAESRTAMWPR